MTPILGQTDRQTDRQEDTQTDANFEIVMYLDNLILGPRKV